MNNIEKELQEANKYLFSTFKNNNGDELVELSLENVAKAEAMIQNDSSYRKTFNKDAKPKNKYEGSVAYWITKELKPILLGNKHVTNDEYKIILENLIKGVDRENNTHLNSDGCGIEQICDRLSKINKQKLVYYLKEPFKSNFELINIIAQKTNPTNLKYNGRINISFASKFCHLACYFLFEGKAEQDNYPIYDNVLKKAIPKYLDFYGLKKIDYDYKKYNNTTSKSIGEFYKTYYESIDEIIKASKISISRNGFDHLLWYYYKGRNL